MDYKTSHDLIDVLADLWPQCFVVYERRRRPLKLGIHHDIEAAGAGAITAAEISAALRLYCSNIAYPRACHEDADRIDLSGNPAGTVSASEAANCAASLQAQQAKRAAKTNGANPNRAAPVASMSLPTSPSEPTSPSPNGKPAAAKAVPVKPAGPRRLGLADLREAWRQRQRQAGLQP
jgi:ProP effector